MFQMDNLCIEFNFTFGRVTQEGYKGTCVLIDKDYADIDLAGLPNDTMSSMRKL